MATVTGGSGNDSLVGSTWLDTLYGGAGNDTMLAYGGDDSIFGGSGTDVLYAGDGQDVGFGGAGNDTAYGEAGNDTLLGGGGADVFYGDSGMDVLLGEAGNDTLDGGNENDLVEGGVGSDKLLGGAGNDTLSGDASAINPGYFASTGAADTTLTIVNTASFAIDVYWINTNGVGVYSGTIAPGGSLIKTTGSTHNWYLTEQGQTAVLDLIQGAPNQTYTLTPDFNDTLDGGIGDDQINGGLGADSVLAGDGNDIVTGGVGNDTVFGGQGSDNITLGDGNDSFGDWSTEGGNDTVYGGAGNDYIIAGGENDLVDGGDGDDSLSGGIGSDSAYGGAGSDVFLVTDDHEYDYIDGGETGSDFDIVYFGNYLTTQGVTVTFSGTGAGSYDFDGSLSYGSFVGIEALGGTDYADVLNAGADAGGIRLEGNAGNDRITGGSGNDTLYGGVGADTINFGAGADTVYGGDGDDWIDDVNGGNQVGANLIYAGAGNDHIWTGGGNDTVYGEDGNDVIDAEIGNDSVFGGAGSDTISGGDGNDTLSGGAGNDTLSGDADSDLIAITANEGVDLVYGGETGSDRDTLQLNSSANEANTVTFTGNEAGTYAYAGGGSGSFSQIEVIETAGGNDRVDASAATAAVEVYGGTGQDTLIGGGGADTLAGGTGGDVILGGLGSDLIITGAGADQIGLIHGGGGDIVQDFDMTLVAGVTADQLDVSDLRTLDGKPLHARDVVVSSDGSGNAVLTFPQGEQVTLIGVAPSAVTGKQALSAIGVPCFVRGTRILTPMGERRVEDLRAGDLVQTLDAGAQPILWVGARQLAAQDLEMRPDLRPVLIRDGALGNHSDLLVSPQHALLVATDQGARLVRARHLAQLDDGRFRLALGRREVCYHHVLLPQHAVIFANGAACESLYPGAQALRVFGRAVCAELLAVMPQLQPAIAGSKPTSAVYGPLVRPLLARNAVQRLGRVHAGRQMA